MSTETSPAAFSGSLTLIGDRIQDSGGGGLFSVTTSQDGVEALRFVVFGEAKSAGSKRAFRHPHTGALIVTETVKGSKGWQAQVCETVGAQYDGPLLDGPLQVVMTFYRPRPRSHYGTGRNRGVLKPSAPRFPSTRPDALKLARGVEDALTGVVWTDDSRIVDGRQVKEWGEPARLELEVRRL